MESLQVKAILKGKTVILLEDIPFVTYSGEGKIVPKGFESDLASIPRIFRSLIPKMDKHFRAAIIHDYLYTINHERGDSDRTFLKYMKKAGVTTIKRHIMFYAVRCFGWIKY